MKSEREIQEDLQKCSPELYDKVYNTLTSEEKQIAFQKLKENMKAQMEKKNEIKKQKRNRITNIKDRSYTKVKMQKKSRKKNR